MNLVLFLSLLTVSVAFSGQAMAQNLLQNPSFEDGSGFSFAGWTGTLDTSDNTYPIATTPHDGSHYVGEACAFGTGTVAAEARQVVTVTPGETYNLSAWVNTDESINTCSAFLEWVDGAATGDGEGTTLASFTSNTSGWEELTGQVSPTGTEMTFVVRLSWDCVGSGGGGHLDDVSMTVHTLSVQDWELY